MQELQMIDNLFLKMLSQRVTSDNDTTFILLLL